MSYVTNPATGTLGSSRPNVNGDFSYFATILQLNHGTINTANFGLHSHVDLPAQGSDPNPAPSIISLYSKTASGVTELFLQKENTGTVIQMSVGSPTIASSGSTFLPGGIILKWGSGNFTTPVVFAGGVFPHNLYSVVVTSTSGAVGVTIGASTTTGFTASASAGATSFTYIAIGN